MKVLCIYFVCSIMTSVDFRILKLKVKYKSKSINKSIPQYVLELKLNVQS